MDTCLTVDLLSHVEVYVKELVATEIQGKYNIFFQVFKSQKPPIPFSSFPSIAGLFRRRRKIEHPFPFAFSDSRSLFGACSGSVICTGNLFIGLCIIHEPILCSSFQFSLGLLHFT